MKTMTLYSGVNFDPIHPDSSLISIKDVAHALSLMCRGNGQVKHFYSVGQHSVNCAYYAKDLGYSVRVQLACLLHDASEAYMADITRPVKQHLPQYLVLEEKLQETLYTVLGVDGLSDDERRKLSHVDDTMLNYELYHLLGLTDLDYPKSMDYCLGFLPMQDIEEEFLSLYKKLLKEIR